MKIGIIDFNISGIGGAPVATKEIFYSFSNSLLFEKVILLTETEIKDRPEILQNFDLLHLPVLGSSSERQMEEKPLIIKILEDSEKPFTVDLRASWDMEIYPFSSELLNNKKCKAIVTISKDLQKFYKKKLKRKIYFIDQWRTLSVPNILPKKKNKVVCFSRITPSKCIHEFALCCKEINAECLCYGPINYQDYFNLFKDCENFSYKGELLGETEIINALLDAKFVIDLSTFENDGDRLQFTLLEGMTLNCIPVMKKQWFGRLEDNKNGIMIDKITDIPKKINSLLLNENLQNSIINNNKKILKKKFNKNTGVKKYMQIFEKIREEMNEKY
ncbi:MAG: hypothetical protein Q8O84_02965 [Nanoarchaeota archaeon]|nr:hypothetical protein [Nanoarchaeota archaeon]